jgi:ribosomal protein L37AE/L43A
MLELIVKCDKCNKEIKGPIYRYAQYVSQSIESDLEPVETPLEEKHYCSACAKDILGQIIGEAPKKRVGRPRKKEILKKSSKAMLKTEE